MLQELSDRTGASLTTELTKLLVKWRSIVFVDISTRSSRFRLLTKMMFMCRRRRMSNSSLNCSSSLTDVTRCYKYQTNPRFTFSILTKFVSFNLRYRRVPSWRQFWRQRHTRSSTSGAIIQAVYECYPRLDHRQSNRQQTIHTDVRELARTLLSYAWKSKYGA